LSLLNYLLLILIIDSYPPSSLSITSPYC